MTRIFLAGALALALFATGGCVDTINRAETAVGSVTASPKNMAIAANSFDTLEVTAAGYITYCTPKPMPIGCDVSVIRKVIKAVQSGRTARNNLEAFVAANPGKAGPVTVYKALVAATNTLQQIEAQYNIGKK